MGSDHRQDRDSDSLNTHDSPDWLQQIHARGLTDAFRVALSALGPLGPLGAQLLFVAQPALSLFGMKDAVREIAQTLEAPGGVDRLLEQLERLDHDDNSQTVDKSVR